jgi:diguanylate cyclase (GGDEF)-like protein
MLICDVFKHSPVFRLGGDEFVSILQKEDYERRTELCREFDLRSYKITEAADEPWKEINVAGGIAIYDPNRDKNANAVVKRADKKMYEDKERKKSGIMSTLLTEEELRGCVSAETADTAGE